MRQMLRAQALFCIPVGAIFFWTQGANGALSFLAGSLLMSGVLVFFNRLCRSMIAKKRIALPGSVIVLKYPLALAILVFLTEAGCNPLAIGAGIAAASLSFLGGAAKELSF